MRVKIIIMTVIHQMKVEAGFTVAIIGSFLQKMIAVALQQFGTVLLTDIYEQNGKTDQDAKEHLGKLGMSSNVITLVFMFVFGYLADRFKVWKLLMFVNYIVFGFFCLALYDIWSSKATNIGYLYDIGYSISQGFHSVAYMLCITYLARIVNDQTRGTMFSFNGFVGSLGVVLLDGLGGSLYSDYSKIAPFIIIFVIYIVYIVAAQLLGLAGKLRI